MTAGVWIAEVLSRPARSTCWVPADQVEWLAADLEAARGKAIVFIHQRLDVSNSYGVKNAAQVRKVLEDSGKVLAVFQGHSHENNLKDINGIHLRCCIKALPESRNAKSY